MTHEEAERFKIARDLRHKAEGFSGLKKRVYNEAADIVVGWVMKDVDLFIRGFLDSELKRRLAKEIDNES